MVAPLKDHKIFFKKLNVWIIWSTIIWKPTLNKNLCGIKKREIGVWIVADAIIHVWTHHLLLSKCWFLSLFFFTFLQKVLFNIEFCMMLDDGMMCWFLFLRFTMCLGLLSYHKWQTAFVVLSSWFFCSVEHMQFQSEKKLSRVQTLVPIQKGSGRGENSRQPGPIWSYSRQPYML